MTDNNYHNFVIKDGKFIGKFEEMYQKCSDPWCQDTAHFKYKYLSLALLKILGHESFKKILDIGCGKGKFTSKIKDEFPSAEVLGIDISETAINKAAERYRNITFRQLDITTSPVDYQKYDCIFMTEVVWYVLPHLERLFSEINEALKKSKGIFVTNNHLYHSEQKYGREYVTTIETLLRIMPFSIQHITENNRFKNYDVSIICTAGNGEMPA